MAKKKTKLDKMSKKERTSLAYALATNLAKYGKPQTPKNERKLTKSETKKREKHMGKFKKAFSLQEAHQLAKIINEGRYGGVPSALDNDPRYLYPDLFKNTPTQTKKEWVVNYMGEEVTVTAYNKGEAIRKGANIMSVPTPDTQYVKATEVTKENLKNPEKADLNKDGKLSSYEKKRGAAIEKAMNEAPGSTLTLSQSDMDKLHKDGKLEIDGHKILFKMNEDLDIGHQDNEPHMLKKDLYRIAKYAAELYKMVDQFDVEGQEVDFPQWWQAKIITSKEAMVKAKHYLDGELQVDKIDSMLEAEEEEKEYKVLSTKELNRLAALPPTHPSHKKDRRYKRLTKKQ